MSKDCECITHEGPHWLHLDGLDRRRNLEHLRRAVEALEAGDARAADHAAYAFARAEIVRLREKGWQMERAGVERHPPNVEADRTEAALRERLAAVAARCAGRRAA